MARAKLKVLVVDDSALMRKHLRELLTETGEFEVSVARDGVDALGLLQSFDPDVITLDINMPVMDGLTCLSRIMTERPKPVVMVSSLTQKGAEVTFEALAMGAVDFIEKPDGTISLSLRNVSGEIVAKVRAAAGARVTRTRGLSQRLKTESGRSTEAAPARLAGARGTGGKPAAKMVPIGEMGLVVIGVSTGGPRALEEVLPLLPVDFPWPVIVAQHMPSTFTGTFSRRLDSICPMTVHEVSSRTIVEPGHCYIGRGDADVVLTSRGSEITVSAVPSDANRLWHPSVARLVETAMKAVPFDRLIGVMLTGMGNDGAEAMTQLHSGGGRTIAEDASTAVVWGMPGELVKHGGATTVLPSNRVAAQLIAWLSAPAGRPAVRRAS